MSISRLLYYRIRVEQLGHRLGPSKDIAGRRLLILEKAEGGRNVWWDLSPEKQVRAYPASFN